MDGLIVFGVAAIAFAVWMYFRRDRKMESKNTKIVVVGLERSAKYGSCPGSAHDVDTMTGILSKYGKPVVLRDSAARKSAVASALKSAADSDLLIFYYSGHGGSEKSKGDKSETDGMDEYLCLYDGPMMDNEVWSIIRNAKGRVFCIFDCCHSATMYQMTGDEKAEVPTSPFTMQMASGPVEQSDMNLLVWSGCPDSGFSYGDGAGGVFTNAIAKAFSPDRTYGEVWAKAKSSAIDQSPTRTQIGVGFGGRVFR